LCRRLRRQGQDAGLPQDAGPTLERRVARARRPLRRPQLLLALLALPGLLVPPAQVPGRVVAAGAEVAAVQLKALSLRQARPGDEGAVAAAADEAAARLRCWRR
jgi:hypothetical protein